MSNYNQQVIYRLRDLGYYGDFNERDVAKTIEQQPKMKHFFDFIKDHVTKDNLVSEDDIEKAEQCFKQTKMTADQLANYNTQADVLRMLSVNEDWDSQEIKSLEREIELMEK
jgi:hypothetical protein